MTAPRLELLVPLRSAVTGDSDIVAALGTWQGEPSVHTRRPVPVDAGYPLVTVGPLVSRTDDDGISDYRPEVAVDVNTYGEADAHYRAVEAVAERIYVLFHRQAQVLSVEDYSVTDIRATGPSSAPVDDDSRVGRRVTLAVRLHARP